MDSFLEIKKIDLWSLFKLAFFIYAAIGLLIGIFYVLLLLFIGGINSAIFKDELPRFGFLTGLMGILMAPFLAFVYGIIGSVFVTIGGWIYNMVASLAGGLKLGVGELAGAGTGASFSQPKPAQVESGPVGPQDNTSGEDG